MVIKQYNYFRVTLISVDSTDAIFMTLIRLRALALIPLTYSCDLLAKKHHNMRLLAKVNANSFHFSDVIIVLVMIMLACIKWAE